MRSATIMAVIILEPLDFVAIPPGSFLMGWDEGHPGERPRHRVHVDGFALARTAVTNRQYAPFLVVRGAPAPPFWDDRRFSDPEQPVVGVSWEDAAAFCRWLGAADGVRYRLPSEAEWERAARGGVEDARYPWGDASPPGTRFDRPPEAALGPTNPFGLLGLSGVCHEWCIDWADDGYYAVSPAANPRGPDAGSRRASRGGAWRHMDPWSPVAHRSSLPPGLRYSDYGFRVLREAVAR
jgi:formylglycine-generating enzyme required for sulfatase activity